MKRRSLLRKKRVWAFVAFAVFLVFAYDFLEFRKTDQSFLLTLDNNAFGYEASVHHFDTLGHHMRYVEVGEDSLPLLVFVHGAPSSAAFWTSYLQDSSLLAQAKLLAVDRPGYGYSDFGRPMPSIAKQAALIAPILRAKRAQHPVIVLHGSSYGGSVIARLAMDYPDLVDGLIFQSASLAPGEEMTYWITYLTNPRPLRWLIPSTFKVANAEKLAHGDELRAMLPHWDSIRAHSIILQGDADDLIFPSNAHFAAERLRRAASVKKIMVPGRGHNLTWTERPLLLESIGEMLEKCAGAYDEHLRAAR